MAKTPREKTPDEIKQQEFIDDASGLDDLDDDLNPGIDNDENSGTTNDDDNSANNETTDAELSGLEAPNRIEPSKVEVEEKEAEADKTPATTEEDKAKEVPPPPETIETETPETPPAQETPPAVVQEPKETPDQPESFTPEQIQEVYKDWRGTTENLLADHHYALKPEELEEFEVEPSKVIPRLMARVYLDAVTAAINQVTTNMPRLVSLTLEENRKSDESENVFFERWPELKSQSELVRRIGANYRTQNMNASAEQFINEVGAAAMVALRLDPSKPNGKANGKTENSVAKPFVPATNNPAPLPAKQKDDNKWSQLNDEFNQEEDADFG